ncbi:ribosomal protein S6 [Morchella snyderi]|nr:ribosomal protein S6 [Morchella snyderi]
MLYELIAVVRGQSLQEVKDIAKSAGTLVLRNGGVVRGYTNWERLLLPKKTHKHQGTHTHGQYFVMRFDANSATQGEIRRTLKLDPRMVSFSVVKLGTKLEEVAEVAGRTFSLKPL